MSTQILKGSRIQAHWFSTNLTCLAGVQAKLGATRMDITGTVRHVRGDHPVTPTEIRLYVDPEGDPDLEIILVRPIGCTCDKPHIEIRPTWVDAVL